METRVPSPYPRLQPDPSGGPQPSERSSHSWGCGEGTCILWPPCPHPQSPLSPPVLSMKETFLVLSLHNKLRSKVQPPAANMQKLVSPPSGSPRLDMSSTSHPMPREGDSPCVSHSSLTS